jgi:deoxyribonuclease-4
MPLLGAHMSIAGGLPRAVERAALHGCQALQIFSKSANQWRARRLPAAEIREFRARVSQAAIAPVVAHASYLINLAAAEPGLRAQSLASFGEEIDRAEALGLLGVVIHPGCHTARGEAEGLRLIAAALDDLLATRRRGRTLVILEQTAGQGTSLGHRFEHLAQIIETTRFPARMGVCLDTCHLLAAGYDIASPEGYAKTFREFDRVVGIDRLRVFHVNDSKKPIGSRVDRHEHIGRGALGLDTFRRLVNDRRFAALPMLLETPKTAARRRTVPDVDPLDRMNLEMLRGLLERRPRRAGSASR